MHWVIYAFMFARVAASSWQKTINSGKYQEDPLVLNGFIQVFVESRNLFDRVLQDPNFRVPTDTETAAMVAELRATSGSAVGELRRRLISHLDTLFALAAQLKALRVSFFVRSQSVMLDSIDFTQESLMDKLAVFNTLIEPLTTSLFTITDTMGSDEVFAHIVAVRRLIRNTETVTLFRELESIVHRMQEISDRKKTVLFLAGDDKDEGSFWIGELGRYPGLLSSGDRTPVEKYIATSSVIRSLKAVENALELAAVDSPKETTTTTKPEYSWDLFASLVSEFVEGDFCMDYWVSGNAGRCGSQIRRIRNLVLPAYWESVTGFAFPDPIPWLVVVSSGRTYPVQMKSLDVLENFVGSSGTCADTASAVAVAGNALKTLIESFFLDGEGSARGLVEALIIEFRLWRNNWYFKEPFSLSEAVDAVSGLVADVRANIPRTYLPREVRDGLVRKCMHAFALMARHRDVEGLVLLDDTVQAKPIPVGRRREPNLELACDVQMYASLALGRDGSGEASFGPLVAQRSIYLSAGNPDIIVSEGPELRMKLTAFWDMGFGGLGDPELMWTHIASFIALYPLLFTGDEAIAFFCHRLAEQREELDRCMRIPDSYFWGTPAAQRAIILHCPDLGDHSLRIARMKRDMGYGDTVVEMMEGILRTDRTKALETAYTVFKNHPPEVIRWTQFKIDFTGEPGVDAGGLRRDWYMEITQQLFDPKRGLFEQTAAGGLKVSADSALAEPAMHLRYLRFAGKFVAKAIIDMQPIPVRFTKSIYRAMLHGSWSPIDETDYAAEDPEHYRALQQLLLSDVSDDQGGLSEVFFTVDRHALGKTTHVNLIKNGDQVRVNNANKHEYVRLLIEYKLKTSVNDQMGAFLEGFSSILSRLVLRRHFRLEELEVVIAGDAVVDIEDLMTHTEYCAGYNSESPEITWFWEIVRDMIPEQVLKLIKFVTGSSQVPVGGFAQLQQGALDRPGKFTIERTQDTSRLPTSRTCFNKLVLPPYSTKAEMEWKLKIAIEEGIDAFRMA